MSKVLGSRRTLGIGLAALLVGAVIVWDLRRPGIIVPLPDIKLATPSQYTSWPWPDAKIDKPQRGVTHWKVVSRDGTHCDLLRFDFRANPNLRFELYAQDEDDAKPLDNVVKFWAMGVGQATRHVNERFAPRGKVVAMWNGPFFGYHRVAPIPDETGFHVSPIALKGKVYHNTANHRWAFGAKYFEGRPRFQTQHLASRPWLEKNFDFGTGSVQCLVRNGQPLKLEPFPQGPRDFKPQPVPSTPQEVGHVPYFDHAKFSRASIGWSKDDTQLYLLLIREPPDDREGESIKALMKWQPQSKGWNVPDLQRFWLSMRQAGLVWNAINSDAGDVAQLTVRQSDGRYELISPPGTAPFVRKVFDADFRGAPDGGSISYFYVRDTAAR